MTSTADMTPTTDITPTAGTTSPATADTDVHQKTAGWMTVSTPCGPFTAIADDAGEVLASGWTDGPDELVGLIHRSLRPETVARSATLTDIADAVEAYHSGDLTAPDRIRVVARSGPFIERAWEVLRAVPAGDTVSYTRFAELSGEPLAIRGAAAACSRNPTALFVPCHRVLRSDGTLGGFRYGLDVKRWLIGHEQRLEVLG